MALPATDRQEIERIIAAYEARIGHRYKLRLPRDVPLPTRRGVYVTQASDIGGTFAAGVDAAGQLRVLIPIGGSMSEDEARGRAIAALEGYEPPEQLLAIVR